MLGFVLFLDWTLARQYTSRHMPVKSDQTLGWTRRSAAISVLLVLEEQRKRAGERVVKLREAKNWSQEDLAAKSGLSVKTISRFENGRHEGRNDTIRKLARALKVNEVDVTGPPPPPLGLVAEPGDTAEVGLESVLAQLLTAVTTQNELLARQSEVLDRIEKAIDREERVTTDARESTRRLLDAVDDAIPFLGAGSPRAEEEPSR